MIKQFAHLCIHSNNLEETEKFYCETLGFTKKFNFIKDEELIGIYIDLGNNNFLEFFHSSEKMHYSSPLKHFCFEVDNIDSTIDKLKNASIEVTNKKLGSDKSWQCWITDPNGILIEIQQYTEDSSQFTGKNCIVDW